MSLKTNTQEDIHLSSPKKDIDVKVPNHLNISLKASNSFLDISPTKLDLICFSHLRWDFVYQRPQHLFSRFAKHLNVYFLEEPLFDVPPDNDFLSITKRDEGVTVLVPHLSPGRNFEQVEQALSGMINKFITDQNLSDIIAWYYTPMALGFTRFLKPILTVYDCMDELSAFVGAPPELCEREAKLLRQADLVFTGGISLYEAKKNLHENVYAFPSSIEVEHFRQARKTTAEPEDQSHISHPRIGFFGVIDERMDIDLIREVAHLRPEWQFIFIGPVVKIDPATLPKTDSIHYLGMKSYKELPQYISGWEVAMLPFALNESTRFISPTKTPEYLASGKPVVSSAIRDVVQSYGTNGFANIYKDANGFITAVEAALQQGTDANWLEKVDNELSKNSWDLTSGKMMHLMVEKILIKS